MLLADNDAIVNHRKCPLTLTIGAVHVERTRWPLLAEVDEFHEAFVDGIGGFVAIDLAGQPEGLLGIDSVDEVLEVVPPRVEVAALGRGPRPHRRTGLERTHRLVDTIKRRPRPRFFRSCLGTRRELITIGESGGLGLGDDRQHVPHSGHVTQQFGHVPAGAGRDSGGRVRDAQLDDAFTVETGAIEAKRSLHLPSLAHGNDHRAPQQGVSSVRTIAISGSASGIGAATRSMLEADGHRVIGIDLRDADVIADLSTDEGRADAIAATLDRCDGVLDGLVPGAGLGPPVDAGLIAEVNYFGSEALLAGLRPALAAGDQPSVVQIGSNSTTLTPNLPDELVDAFSTGDRSTIAAILAETGPPFDSSVAYGASKTAITRWCRRHATTDEWVGAGIRLNVIAPGAVQTPLLQGGDDDPTFGPLTSGLPVPTGRGEPADIASWICFMLSPAARFACGSVVFVDGGSDAVVRTDDWPRTFTM